MFSSPKTFHRKFGLRAENYFADPQVLQLCEAIEQDDLAAMRRLIEAGADVNAEGKFGVTPLFWAFPDNKIERFRLLLEKGANPNVRLMSDLGVASAFVPGDTVMHLSARSQFPEHFSEVMKHGGDANLRGRHGDCVIHELIKGGVPNPEERIEIAVKYGADINALDRSGHPALKLACGWGAQFALASVLLKLGADPTIRQADGLQTAIHAALAFDRNVKDGLQIATPDQQAAADSFLQLLKARGYDLSEAQADLDRWSRLAKMRPGNPGWYREKEIAALQERDAKQNQKLQNDDN